MTETVEKVSETEDGGAEKKNDDWVNQLVLEGLKLGLASQETGDKQVLDVFEKLQEIMVDVSHRVEQVSDDLPWWCFVSLIQLNESLKKHHPEYRDESYRNGGEPVTVEELQQALVGVELAEWAYEEDYPTLKKRLLSKNHVLLRHEMQEELGRVGHFISINHKDKIALIGLKGTSTFSDLVTDVTGSTVEHTLEASFDESYTSDKIRCHEGIWNTAKTMANDLEELVSNLFLPSGYKVMIVGHSLGGGTACLLGLLLRCRIPELRGDKLQVLAIAPPPVLNHEAALVASSFCTSIVNNNDIVPRMSLSNLLHLAESLVHIEGILEEKGMKPHDVGSALRYVKDLMQSDSEPIMSCNEVDAFYDEQTEYRDHDDNLFVPGRVITMWYLKDHVTKEDPQDDNAESSKDGTSSDCEEEEEKKKSKEESRMEDIKKQMNKIKTINAVSSNGSMRMLRQLEMESSFLDDHRTEFYQASVQALLQQIDE